MPQTKYVHWLLRVTAPADNHQIVRVMPMNAPDNEVAVLTKYLPRLNKDLRVVDIRRFEATDEFRAALKEANAEAISQPGYKRPGKYDMQLSQQQVDKIKSDRDEALAKVKSPKKPL